MNLLVQRKWIKLVRRFMRTFNKFKVEKRDRKLFAYTTKQVEEGVMLIADKYNVSISTVVNVVLEYFLKNNKKSFSTIMEEISDK